MALWGQKKTPETDLNTGGPGVANGANATPVIDTMYGKPSPSSPLFSPDGVQTQPRGNPHFGIDQTIQLMRSLPPNKDPGLVVAVMKATLESVNVHVQDIVQDAQRRLGDVEGRIVALKAENEEFEREMDKRIKEIMTLEAQHAEVSKVKDFLASPPNGVPGPFGNK